jgi:hypothetical protein
MTHAYCAPYLVTCNKLFYLSVVCMMDRLLIGGKWVAMCMQLACMVSVSHLTNRTRVNISRIFTSGAPNRKRKETRGPCCSSNALYCNDGAVAVLKMSVVEPSVMFLGPHRPVT